LYFQEVDAFELMEESPSPKKVGSWIAGNATEDVPLPSICSRLEKWLHARRLNPRCDPSSTLSKILDTPTMKLETIYDRSNSDFRSRSLDRNEMELETIYDLDHESSDFRLKPMDQSELSNSQLQNLKTGETKSSKDAIHIKSESCEDIEAGVKKLSLTSTSSSFDDHNNPFAVLLETCGQSAPSMLEDLFSRYRYVSCFLVMFNLGFWATKVYVSQCLESQFFSTAYATHFYSRGYNRCFFWCLVFLLLVFSFMTILCTI